MCNGILDPRPLGIALLSLLLLISPGARADEDSDTIEQTTIEVTGLGAGDLPTLSGEFQAVPSDASSVLNGQLQIEGTDALLQLTVEDVGEVNATAAAIGNSASMEIQDDVSLESIQEVRKGTNSHLELSATGSSGNLNGTAAAIGNSLALSSEGVMGASLLQGNTGEMVSSTLEVIEASTSGGVAMTGASIGNSASFDNTGPSQLAGAQQSEADVASSVSGVVSEAGEAVTLTSAAMANSLSGTGTGVMETATNQVNDGSLIRADLTGSLTNIGGDMSLTGAALGNSMTLTQTGEHLAFRGAARQENRAGVGSAVSMGEITGSGKINATAAAIGNTLSITNKLPSP